MDEVIEIVPRILSDRSTVWNVWIGRACYQAVSQDDARHLAEKVRRAIEDHSVNEVKVRWPEGQQQ